MNQLITIYGISISYGDMIAIAWFFALWVSYAWFADYRKGKSSDRCLVMVMFRYRLQWMEQMMLRDNRMMDAKVASNIMGSVTFFASTSIFILIGLVTLMGYSEEAIALLNQLPFVVSTDISLWEIKILLLMGVFIYCFFTLTWALRQFNYTSIMIAGAPIHKTLTPKAKEHAKRIAKILSLAARNFNMGMRGYYFGLAALGWFMHPIIFIITTTWVVIILFRRELNSKTLEVLSEK